MFWTKKERIEETAVGRAEKVADEAEGLFRSGKMHCAEAVLEAIRTNFLPETPAEVIGLAAGFGGGSGSGCLCGAVSGGTLALGLALKGDRKRTAQLTKDLHHWFKQEYGATCCKLITTKGKSGCPLLTGRVAGKVAEMLMQ